MAGVGQDGPAGRFGKEWSASWAEAGWVGPSTAVPRTIEGRIALGFSLQNFFTKNPTFEVPNMEITADIAGDLATTAMNTQQATATAEQALKDADIARQPGKADMLKLISRVILNLDGMLAPDDPRWLAFGPDAGDADDSGSADRPAGDGVVGTQVLLQCDVTPLATRYRFRTRVVGVETDYKLAKSSKEPSATLEDMLPGSTLQIIAQAVNGGSQGVACDPITITVPLSALVAAKPVVSEAELAPLAAIVPNGTSNGNGNGNGSHAVNRLS